MIGKLLGGGLGFFLGGPLGALIGVSIGHSIDKESEQSRTGSYSSQHKNLSSSQKQGVFYMLLVSLCAKMIKADGKIDSSEIKTVKDFFRNQMTLDESSMEEIKVILKQSLNEDYSVYDLLEQWKNVSGNDYRLNLEIINLLFKIALSDGKYHDSEKELIETVVNCLQISSTDFEKIKNLYILSDESDYKILGLSPGASKLDIKKAYRSMVSQYHPDKLVSKGLPEDMIKFANEKMNKINQAYEKLTK